RDIDDVNKSRSFLQEYSNIYNNLKTFGQLIKYLGNKIIELKVNRVNITNSFNFASKIFKLCESCNEDIATSIIDRDYLCESCKKKRDINDEIKFDKESLYFRLCTQYYGISMDEAFKKFPVNLSKLVRTEENNYTNLSELLGFIKIDGNNFGEKLHYGRTISEYKTISAELETLVTDLFFKAIVEIIDINEFNTAPFDIFYIGDQWVLCN
ncbi:MAG: hypothetical protein ACTSRP_13465, partial [Candidatus Helarchaeota archaeon]